MTAMLDPIRGWLDQSFGELVAEHEVPGAAVAVLVGAEADHQSFAFVGDDGHGRAEFIHNGRVLRRMA